MAEDTNPLSVENASRRIIGELLAEPEYKYADPRLVAAVVQATVFQFTRRKAR